MGAGIHIYASHFNVYDLEHTPKLWAPPQELEEQIETQWREKRTATNNELFRIKRARAENGTCYLHTQLTTYREHSGTIKQTRWGDRANALFRSAFVITAPQPGGEHELILTMRDNVDRGKGEVGISAAGVLASELKNEKPDLDGAITRILYSDFGLPENIIASSPRHPFLVWGAPSEPAPSVADICHLPIPYPELRNYFNDHVAAIRKQGRVPKKSGIIAVPATPEGIRSFIAKGEYTLRPLEYAALTNLEEIGWAGTLR
jgi:hypothetical protein